MDINKIIMESIEETMAAGGDDDDKDKLLTEGAGPGKPKPDDDPDEVYESDVAGIVQAAIPSAISAGLGALSLRRAIQRARQ